MGLNSANTFCKVVIYNYFVLALILCQIWLWLCSIMFTLYFRFYCKGCVCESVKTQAIIEDQVDFARRFVRNYPAK